MKINDFIRWIKKIFFKINSIPLIVGYYYWLKHSKTSTKRQIVALHFFFPLKVRPILLKAKYKDHRKILPSFFAFFRLFLAFFAIIRCRSLHSTDRPKLMVPSDLGGKNTWKYILLMFRFDYFYSFPTSQAILVNFNV